MRYIIQGINQQIKENPFSKVVYRIHYLSLEDFEKLKEHLNGLISFGSFVDCTLNEPSNIENINQMERILFRIETKYGIETEKVRYFDSKIEVLLPLDNVYYIQSIEQNSNHYWIIHLRNIDQNNKQFQQLTNEMRQHIEGPVVLIQYGKLLISNNYYLEADYLARLLFNDQSLKDNPTLLASLAALHHLLGSVDNKENNYKSARLQFEQSLKIFLTFIPEDNQILSATYNNIGSMFYQEDEHDQAIIYHQKALQCQLKSSSPDIEAIATYSGNIGAVYLDQGKYDQALINYKRSLQILQQSIPNGESLSIAMIYDRIASVYWKMDKTNEALTFYQQALELELKYLPENDHKISVSYFNLSTAYAKLNRLDDAIHSAEKSIQQLLKSVPPDHPEVKENTEQLEGLRRRKWLQQLYQ
jgi:tetratricopeptide (TPR) repeat protein